MTYTVPHHVPCGCSVPRCTLLVAPPPPRDINCAARHSSWLHCAALHVMRLRKGNDAVPHTITCSYAVPQLTSRICAECNTPFWASRFGNVEDTCIHWLQKQRCAGGTGGNCGIRPRFLHLLPLVFGCIYVSVLVNCIVVSAFRQPMCSEVSFHHPSVIDSPGSDLLSTQFRDNDPVYIPLLF